MLFLKTYVDFLLEGLSKDQEDYYLEDWDQERLEDWFGKNNHRLYFPLKKKVGEVDVSKFLLDGEESIEDQIKEYLTQAYGEQYVMDDYIKGYLIDTKNKNRQVRIGKVIKDRRLLQAFNDDPLRAGHRTATKDPIICLSKHPLDIAAMSTGRGWKSCKELPNEANPEGGENYKFLKEEVKVLLIAYLIYPDDKKIEHPIARVNLMPYYNDRGQTYYNVHYRIYGSPGKLENSFYSTIKQWLDEKQKDLKNTLKTFTLDTKVYNDYANKTIKPGGGVLDEWIESDYIVEDGKIYVDGDVVIKKPIKNILKDIGQFEEVTGKFICRMVGLTSLEGAPRKVGKSFDCSGNKLTSLEWCPREVGMFFDCSDNQLTSLEGSPKELEDGYNCSHNQLYSLEGGPEEVGGSYNCSTNLLKSLKGGPRYVYGIFDCRNNKLTSLEYSPEHVDDMTFYCQLNKLTTLKGVPKYLKTFDCSNNQLKTLSHGPEEIELTFGCSRNQLKSLIGGPLVVGGDYYCEANQLTSLEGVPEQIGGHFDCSFNELTSLEGGPREVEGTYDCSFNKLTSTRGGPEYVGGDFASTHNHITSYADLGPVMGKIYKD